MIVTRQWLESHKTKRGGWTDAQMVLMGGPEKGWLKCIVGTEISDEVAAMFIEFSVRATSKKARDEMMSRAVAAAVTPNRMFLPDDDGEIPIFRAGGTRLYFVVPFAEKEQAKALGMRWDWEVKCWFITAGHQNLGAVWERWQADDVSIEQPIAVGEQYLLAEDQVGKPFAVSRYVRIPSLDKTVEMLTDEELEQWVAHEFYGPSVALEIEHRGNIPVEFTNRFG